MARLQSDQSIIQCHSFTSALVHFAGVQVARLTSCAGESAAHPLIFGGIVLVVSVWSTKNNNLMVDESCWFSVASAVLAKLSKKKEKRC